MKNQELRQIGIRILRHQSMAASIMKVHDGDIVREHIYKLRAQGKNIKLIRFPRYCSNLNPIEEEWRPFKRDLHNQIILVKEQLTSAVVDGIATISNASKGLLSKYFPILFG
jgi:transposase